MQDLTIPPLPDDRPGKYRWIAKLVEMGFTTKKACELAGVPYVSYNKIGRRQIQRAKESAA